MFHNMFSSDEYMPPPAIYHSWDTARAIWPHEFHPAKSARFEHGESGDWKTKFQILEGKHKSLLLEFLERYIKYTDYGKWR